MKREYEKLLFEPQELAIRLWTITNEASHRLEGRIMVDTKDLPRLEFPFGGREGLKPILKFMPYAKEGFSIEIKSSSIIKGDEHGFLLETSPVNLINFEEDLQELGIKLKRAILGEDGRVAVYRSSFAAIVRLSLLGKYADSSGESEWPYRPDVEKIWTLLTEIEQSTSNLLLNENADSEGSKALRALHFFKVCNAVLKRVI